MGKTGKTAKESVLFLSLVSDLSSQAWVCLGKIKNPATDKIERNIPAAGMMIDMLDMLAEKTAGNLSPAEDNLLKETLGQLKLNYVSESGKPDAEETEETDETEEQTSDKAAGKESGE